MAALGRHDADRLRRLADWLVAHEVETITIDV